MDRSQETAALALLAARERALKKLVFSRPVAPDIVRTVGTLRTVGGAPVLQIGRAHV